MILPSYFAYDDGKARVGKILWQNRHAYITAHMQQTICSCDFKKSQ